MKKFLLLLLLPLILFGGEYDNLALGVPGKADVIVDRPGYALGYSNYHKQAVWVVYKLTREEVETKVAHRGNHFKSDPAIPSGSASPEDYRKSGYDRGHLAPAADMAWSRQAMADSFYMSNMSPQKPAFNRGIWSKLEAQIRAFAVAEEEIYVITGPILPEEQTITVGGNKVTVPTHFFKIVYDLTPPRKMIAFVLPSEGSSRPLQDFALTVDAAENLTGLDFFSLVPQKEQNKLESTIKIAAWQWDHP